MQIQIQSSPSISISSSPSLYQSLPEFSRPCSDIKYPSNQSIVSDLSLSYKSSQSLPDTIYIQQILAWLTNIGRYLQYSYQTWPISSQYFHSVFLPSISNKFKISIVFDNLITNTITNMLAQLQYTRFSKSQPQSYYHDSILIPIIDYAQQKWVLLLKISQILYLNKFISKSKYSSIQTYTHKQNSLQNKIQTYCQAIYAKRKERKSSSYGVSIKLWNQIVGIDCRIFWRNFICMRPNTIRSSKVMKQLYGLFQRYLVDKFGIDGQHKLSMIIGIGQDKQNKHIKQKNIRQDYLQQMAKNLSLFTNNTKAKQIQKQLNSFQRTLLQKLTKQLSSSSYNHDTVIQTYGSYRNKICLYNSDVDMVLFMKDAQGQINQTRQFICRKLWSIYQILNMNKQQLNIQRLQPVIKKQLTLKVPFIRVYFYEQVLSEMDIVVNNKCGLFNSRMLETFAQNIKIRNIGILLKKWAKKNHLIDKTKLSSYGLTLMMLYFMMSVGLLDFITENQLKDYTFSNRLRRDKQIVDIIKDFMAFYAENSSFYHDREIACLIKGCNRHNNIMNDGFIINIHDPYDDSNPGRMKMSARSEFFRCFQDMHDELQHIKTLDDECKKQYLERLFGYNSEEIFQDCMEIL